LSAETNFCTQQSELIPQVNVGRCDICSQ